MAVMQHRGHKRQSDLKEKHKEEEEGGVRLQCIRAVAESEDGGE